MGTRVVVADDSSTLLALVVMSVQKAGHEPATASNGAEALALVREHRPDLLIVDALMPNMDGYDVCRALQDDADGPKPYVLMLTAGVGERDRELAEEVGVDEFMTKPFSPAALGERVRAILAARA
jgi:DNA-binding response OmpR family regulator